MLPRHTKSTLTGGPEFDDIVYSSSLSFSILLYPSCLSLSLFSLCSGVQEDCPSPLGVEVRGLSIAVGIRAASSPYSVERAHSYTEHSR